MAGSHDGTHTLVPPLLTLGADLLARIADFLQVDERAGLRLVCSTLRDALDVARVDMQFNPCALQQLQYLEAVEAGPGRSSILKALQRWPKSQALIAFGSYCCAWVPGLVTAADEVGDAGERMQAMQLLLRTIATKLQWQCGGVDMDACEGYYVLTARVQYVAEVRGGLCGVCRCLDSTTQGGVHTA